MADGLRVAVCDRDFCRWRNIYKSLNYIYLVMQEDSEASDIYAVQPPVKRRQKKEELPPGWEKHEVFQRSKESEK